MRLGPRRSQKLFPLGLNAPLSLFLLVLNCTSLVLSLLLTDENQARNAYVDDGGVRNTRQEGVGKIGTCFSCLFIFSSLFFIFEQSTELFLRASEAFQQAKTVFEVINNVHSEVR